MYERGARWREGCWCRTGASTAVTAPGNTRDTRGFVINGALDELVGAPFMTNPRCAEMAVKRREAHHGESFALERGDAPLRGEKNGATVLSFAAAEFKDANACSGLEKTSMFAMISEALIDAFAGVSTSSAVCRMRPKSPRQQNVQGALSLARVSKRCNGDES